MRQSPGLLLLLLFLLGAATALHGAPASDATDGPSPAPSGLVGTIAAIDGVVSVQRGRAPQWHAGYVQMPGYVQDRLRTDEHSMAALDLAHGGRLGINRASEVELQGEGGHTTSGQHPDLGQTIVLSSGTVWAKFDKQEHPVQIRTGSALLTIKGTEFTVETTADNTTTLSVLEGTVACTPLGLESPEPATLAEAGTEVTVPLRRRAMVRRVGVEALRKRLEKRHPQFERWYARRIMLRRARYAEYQFRRAQVVRNPNRLQGRALPPDDPRRPPRLRRPGAPTPGPAPGNGAVDHPTSLSPHEQESRAEGLSFRWAPVPGCTEYAVVMSSHEDFSTIDWSARAHGTSVPYPKNGFPLRHGQRYYWRVVGINADGVPQGKAAQTFFTVAP